MVKIGKKTEFRKKLAGKEEHVPMVRVEREYPEMIGTVLSPFRTYFAS